MKNEEKWMEKAKELAPDHYLNTLTQDAFIKGYLQGHQDEAKERQEEIEKLIDLISESGPLAWMAHDNIYAAHEWEKKAFELIGGKVR